MHWNLMNDQEILSIKFLKLKYRKKDQIIQSFCKSGSPSLISRNFKTLTKVLVNDAECIEI